MDDIINKFFKKFGNYRITFNCLLVEYNILNGFILKNIQDTEDISKVFKNFKFIESSYGIIITKKTFNFPTNINYLSEKDIYEYLSFPCISDQTTKNNYSFSIILTYNSIDENVLEFSCVEKKNKKINEFLNKIKNFNIKMNKKLINKINLKIDIISLLSIEKILKKFYDKNFKDLKENILYLLNKYNYSIIVEDINKNKFDPFSKKNYLFMIKILKLINNENNKLLKFTNENLKNNIYIEK